MKWVAVAALAIAALAPDGARAGTVLAAPPPTAFDLAALVDGADRVLAAVEPDAVRDETALRASSGGAVIGLPEVPRRRADAAARVNAAYAAVSAVSVTDSLPEPTTWLMMILGFLGLSFAVRRRGQEAGNRVRFQ